MALEAFLAAVTQPIPRVDNLSPRMSCQWPLAGDGEGTEMASGRF
jgi:hypothetical protein